MVFNSPCLIDKKELIHHEGTALVVEMVINSPWIIPLLGTKGLASPEQTATSSKSTHVAAVVLKSVAGSRFPKGSSMLLTFDVQFLEGVLMKYKDAASSRDIQQICAEFSSIQVKTQADWMLLQSSYFNPQVPTGRVVVPTSRYVVPAGKVIIIVSHGRLSLVPTGRVLSPGRVKYEPTTLVANKAIHKERGDSVERASTIATSLDAEQDISNINRTQSTTMPNSYDLPLGGVNTPQSDEDRIKLKELMEICTKLSEKVLDLEKAKTAQAKEIASLKRRSLGEEDASKQGRNLKQRSIFEESDFDADMDKVFKDVEGYAETEVNIASAPVTTAGVSTLMKMKSEKSKVRGIVIKEPSETAIRITVPPQQHNPKDKARLEEEERLARQREEDVNIAEWGDVQAIMDADYKLAARLQA
ncbi:hypothetical protein Tco_0322998 [Tanacetum coccineum]